MLQLIACTTFLTGFLAFLALLCRPKDPMDARLDRLLSGNRADVRTADRRQTSPLRGAAGLLHELLPNRWYERLGRSLVAAGQPADGDLFVLVWVSLIVLGGLLGLTILGPRGLIGFAVAGALAG